MDIATIKQKKLITAIKTPFDLDGSIDFEAFDALIQLQIEAGVDGIIVGGTTGEGHLFDWKEHLSLIGHCTNNFKNKLTIVGNTGSNNTKESVEATKFGFSLGMDAALLINPYYGKTSSAGTINHICRALDYGPGIIYNVPSRTANDISIDTMQEIAKHKNFVAVKECMGNERISDYHKLGIACWSGNDDQAVAGYLYHNSLGVISVASNIIPAKFKQMLEGDEALYKKCSSFINWLFIEPNPIPLNSLLADLRLVKPVFRLPYLPLSIAQRQSGIKLLSEIEPQFSNAKALSDSDFILV